MIYFSKEDTMNKCGGCGAILQCQNPNQEGYIQESAKNKNLCERCFRIQNYNEYKRVTKVNTEFLENLDQIKQTGDLTLLVLDLFHMNQNILEIAAHCSKNMILVLTKRDLLPLSVSDEKLEQYGQVLGLNPLETFVISATKNKGLDALYEAIQTYQTSKYVYLVGYTNAGKSTLVNHLISHYSDLKQTITTSMLSSTTLANLEIPLQENLVLLDTPGILEEGNICEQVELPVLKRILPKKEIKPITYQVKAKQSIWIENLVRMDAEDNNFTLYFSNQLKIERTFKIGKETNLIPHIINVKANEDLVILGLGFIKVGKDEIVTIYTLPNVHVFTRKSLI